MSNQASNFVKILKEICTEEGISLRAFSDDFAFHLEKNGRYGLIFGYQFGLNPASVHMVCEDKSTASELLKAAGVPCVEHRCFMSPANLKYLNEGGNWEGMREMLACYKEVVLKDNKGTGGFQVIRAKNERELEYAANTLLCSAHSVAVSPYIEIEQECRAIILDGEIKLIYSKERESLTGDGIHTLKQLYARDLSKGKISAYGLPKEIEYKILSKGEIYPLEWRHNLGQGAHPVLITDDLVKEPLKKLALDAVRVLGARFVSVDMIKEKNGGWMVLEINSGVMMENLAGENPAFYTIAKDIYREALKKML